MSSTKRRTGKQVAQTPAISKPPSSAPTALNSSLSPMSSSDAGEQNSSTNAGPIGVDEPPITSPLQDATPNASTTTSLVQTTITPLPDFTTELKVRLQRDALYLGDKVVTNKVAWIREGKADRLVLRDSETTHAILSCVAEIDTSEYWLTSDANFQGNSNFVKNLADVKATCMMMKPTMEFFLGKWQSVLTNLWSLMDKIAKLGGTIQGVFVMRSSTCFKVQHVLFLKRDGEDFEEERADLGEEFTMAGWHVWSNTAREHLEEMKAKESHGIHPILTYVIFGKIVKPKDYRKILAGATVDMHFKLTHYTISRYDDNGRQIKGDTIATFVADIEQIRVLSTPRVATPPSKQKILAKDPSTSPSSKRGKMRAD